MTQAFDQRRSGDVYRCPGDKFLRHNLFVPKSLVTDGYGVQGVAARAASVAVWCSALDVEHPWSTPLSQA
jgi:hypothetical protein